MCIRHSHRSLSIFLYISLSLLFSNVWFSNYWKQLKKMCNFGRPAQPMSATLKCLSVCQRSRVSVTLHFCQSSHMSGRLFTCLTDYHITSLCLPVQLCLSEIWWVCQLFPVFYQAFSRCVPNSSFFCSMGSSLLSCIILQVFFST